MNDGRTIKSLVFFGMISAKKGIARIFATVITHECSFILRFYVLKGVGPGEGTSLSPENF